MEKPPFPVLWHPQLPRADPGDQGAAILLHRGRRLANGTPALEAKILDWTRRPPNDGTTHGSSRRVAQALDRLDRVLPLSPGRA